MLDSIPEVQMRLTTQFLATALAGFTVIATTVAAQQPAPQQPAQQPAPQTPPSPQQPPAPPPQTPGTTGRGGRGRGQGGQGGGRDFATFPAQQRQLADPETIAKGKGLFTTNCSSCHGADLRGGVTGGPNLLRSSVVLMDQHGELVLPIVHGARAERGMPALPLPDPDVVAIAEYIHSVVFTARGQGAPPESDAPPPNAVVGDAKAGEAYFSAHCSSCHSPTGDLAGIGSRIDEGKALQNFWIVGGGGGGRGRGGAAPSDRRIVTATVTMPNGEKVQGQVVRLDNFFITLLLDDGRQRTIRREGDVPKVDVKDPLDFHKKLPAILTDKDMHDVTAYLATLK
jgi:cytochrome c oxidase cbb3-type subunit III